MINHLPPIFYDIVQLLIRGEKFQKKFVNQFVKPRPGMKVLDVGCGTGWLFPLLPSCKYTGIDACPARIKACRRRFKTNRAFQNKRLGKKMPFRRKSYDLAIAFGLLHHLDDSEAKHLVNHLRLALKAKGRLITVDGVFLKRQNKIKKILLKLDKGRFIRTKPQYKKILASNFKNVRTFIRNDIFRLPYDLLIAEATA
jgi:SAM-dependent methyltransferase